MQTLHRIIQVGMSWLDCHFWEFKVDDTLYDVPDLEGAACGHVVQRGSATNLAKLLKDGATTLR